MKKYTLEKKIRTSFILVFTCIFLISIVFMAGVIRKVYRDKSYGMCEELVSLNLDILNSQIMDIQKTMDIIGKNADVRKAVAYFSHRDKKDYLTELNIQRSLDDVFYNMERNNGAWNAYITDNNGQCLYAYIRSLNVGQDMNEEPWYAELVSQIKMNTCYISDVHDRSYLVSDNKGECVSMILPIQEESGYAFHPKAYLVCDIDLNKLLYGSSKSDMKFALMDRNGYLHSAEGSGLTEDEEKLLAGLVSQNTEEPQVVLSDNKWFSSRILLAMKSRLNGWRVIGIKTLKELRAMDTALGAIFVMTSIGAVFFIILLSRQISRSILNPMNHLIEACNRVSQGDYTVEFPDAPSQEVAILSHTVDSMVKSVNSLTTRIIEEEKNLSTEKMKVLQHQINPHFLNNVLQAIKAMAVEGENEKISRIATLLGRFLSYSVYQPYENVRLSEELEYLKAYLEIQNIRYDDNILFTVFLEEGLSDTSIPKLTLQPVVENAIEHGYDGKSRLIIDINAEHDGSVAEICIHDNGKGICEEELAQLQEKLESGENYSSKRSIGIVNVNERLKRLYGPEYGLSITARQDAGTTVVIRIPIKEEKKDAEIIDCR